MEVEGVDDIGRFIPARAGNGRSRGRVTSGLTVHPRACGERLSHRPRNLRIGGSSPRVRGTGPIFSYTHCCPRFIPARAGNGV